MKFCNSIARGVSRASRRSHLAFTLIELLVVITIIGLLAALGLPHLKGWGESNSMSAATRQLMDDLALARQRAISSRSTVYVVFVSPAVANPVLFNALAQAEQKKRSNLFSGQFTSYALYAPRSVGDQPGHPNERYLSAWKSLPEKVFIAKDKFLEVNENARFSGFNETNRPFATNAFPFPTVTSPRLELPYLAFNSQGQLISEKNLSGESEGATIPLAKGSIFYARDGAGNLVLGPADLIETPPGNSLNNFNNIRIDWLTGRSRLEKREF
ncbi:MAG: prepilin-type N-terminal cleavage/methylation domain-containing protein [Verrucomicrobiota bacterium]